MKQLRVFRRCRFGLFVAWRFSLTRYQGAHGWNGNWQLVIGPFGATWY